MASRFLVPFSTSRGLRAPEPFGELHREMNRLFDDFMGGGLLGPQAQQGGMSMMTMPRMDVREREQEICIDAELPGVDPKDVDLRVEGDMLTISGEKKSSTEQNREDVHVMERSYGQFRRSLQLPFAPDPEQVRAEFRNGVLTVHLPKQGQQQRSRRIEVRAAEGEQPGQPAGAGQIPASTPQGQPTMGSSGMQGSEAGASQGGAAGEARH